MSFQELQAKREEMEKTLPSIADLDGWVPCTIQRKPAVVLASQADIAGRILYQTFPAEGAWAKVYDYLALMEKIRDTFITEPLDDTVQADTEDDMQKKPEKSPNEIVRETVRQVREMVLREVWDENENNIRYRVRYPAGFQEGSLRTIWLNQDEGIRAVVGRLKGEEKTSIQSILFSKEKDWTLEKARTWVEAHPDLQVSESEPAATT